uniref:Uncharacterized protein n=1 Tax=Tanacetum cinerariifolium TaxID=118510 RepID=A0A699GWP3_TANCI|nr:hypothetical protein [Tanacetum cinerariifolium]
MTHPHSKRNVVPTTVLTQSRFVLLNAAKPVPTVVTQSTVKCTRTVKNVFNKAHSPVRRPINQRAATKNSNFNKKVTNVKVNKFEEIDRGYVVFGGDPKGENQPNDNACIQENLDAGKVGKDIVSAQQYVLLPLWSSDSQDLQNTDDDIADDAFDVTENKNDVHVFANESDKTDNKKHDEKAKRDDKGKSPIDSLKGVRDLRAEFEEFSFNSTNRLNAISEPVNATGPNPTNSTNSFNTSSPSINDVRPNFEIGKKSSFVDPSKYPDDPDMPELEDNVYSDDEEDVGAKADLSNCSSNKEYDKDDVKSASTPIETKKILLKDPNGEDVDVHIYRSQVNVVKVEKVNGDVQLQDLINDKKLVVTEAIIRRDLHLDDVDGVECLPNVEIFEELARIGYEKPPPKLTFYKAFFFAQWNSMASVVICLATGKKFNYSKYLFDNMVRNVESPSKFSMYPRFIQVLLDHQVDDMTTHTTRYKSLALTQKVFANMRRVRKGFSGVETPLFYSMLVQSQQQADADKEKRVVDETLLQERIKKLRAAEVSRFESTQEIPSDDPKEITKKDVQNMLEIVPVPKFKVEALQVKYPIIDWEIYTEDMLKGFDKEVLVSLWNLVKERFSSTEPIEDKERALWVELKRLFEPYANDVLWKLQRCMHAPLTRRMYSDCRVHHKLQVEKDNEMARDLVLKIYMEANRPRNKSV